MDTMLNVLCDIFVLALSAFRWITDTVYNFVYDVLDDWKYGTLKENLIDVAIFGALFYVLAWWAAI